MKSSACISEGTPILTTLPIFKRRNSLYVILRTRRQVKVSPTDIVSQKDWSGALKYQPGFVMVFISSGLDRLPPTIALRLPPSRPESFGKQAYLFVIPDDFDQALLDQFIHYFLAQLLLSFFVYHIKNCNRKFRGGLDVDLLGGYPHQFCPTSVPAQNFAPSFLLFAFGQQAGVHVSRIKGNLLKTERRSSRSLR